MNVDLIGDGKVGVAGETKSEKGLIYNDTEAQPMVHGESLVLPPALGNFHWRA